MKLPLSSGDPSPALQVLFNRENPQPLHFGGTKTMRQFLSEHVRKAYSGASCRSIQPSIFSASFPATSSELPLRNFCLTVFVVCMALLSSSLAQVTPVPTSRGDNTRSGANTNETLLTPLNVNQTGFGKLFTAPVDYVVMGQPLYMPGVNIPGQGAHNVVYLVTQADSVFAIDADSGVQLWYASMLYGGTVASVSGGTLPCGTTQGYNQEGIVATPVIDTNSNTMYLVAKSVLNGTVRLHLHALDITTGLDEPGSPVLIQAQSTSNKGHVTVFNSLHQMNRPGLLLLNGVLYLGFGSNSCNDQNSGWVLAYNEATLTQQGVFNTSPDWGITSIWQTGNGLAADELGNIFVETAEAGSHGYDVPNGGQTYCNSVVKLSPVPNFELADYFTPWYVAFLDAWDLDLSATGVLVLPDQPGPYIHELVAGGKQGFVYVLDRDNLGMYSTGSDAVIQEFNLVPGTQQDSSTDVYLLSSPAYWNNTVYFAPDALPLMAFPLSNGSLGTPLTTGKYVGGHSPSISANGTTNGLLWLISGPQLVAFNATTLQPLYNTNQATGGRDKLGTAAHFVTQIVANGKVYVATETQTSPPAYGLVAYGLFNVVAFSGGNVQSATVGQPEPAPIQLLIVNPYTGQAATGVTVNFSDGGKGGSFNPPSAVTGSYGEVSTVYTVPPKVGTYTLTISGTGFGNATATATAIAGGAIKLVNYSGAKQTGAAGSTLAKAITVQAQDAAKNGVPGVTVTFTANNGGIVSSSSVITGPTGLASTMLQLPTTVSTVTVTAASSASGGCSGTASACKMTYAEYSVAGPAANVAPTSGNNQVATAGTQLPQVLTVLVTDQYGNPVAGNSVTFSDGGAGGTFSNPNPGFTGTNGTVSQYYTLPASAEGVTITATASGVTNPAAFNETGQ